MKYHLNSPKKTNVRLIQGERGTYIDENVGFFR